MKTSTPARMAALVLFVTLAAPAAFADALYSLRYKAGRSGGRFTFDVAVTHTGSGQTILKSTLRTRPREWGTLQTGHAGRTVRVRVMGEPNGYAALVLDVTERGRSVQHEVFRYTELATAPPVKWRGEPITLHLRDADLADTLIALARLTGTSIAVDPGVSGSVTLDLVDVPSDQALDLILRQHGLVAQTHGQAMFVKRR